jgi:hypothetical protein
MARNQHLPADGFSLLRLSGRTGRENGGTQRRYRFDNGTTLVVSSWPTKRAVIIPRACVVVAVPCDRATAAEALAWGRHNRKGSPCRGY